MRDLLFISQDKEMALIQELIYKIKMARLDIHPSKTCFLCVSPDYSSIVAQHLSHGLSMDGEIFHIEAGVIRGGTYTWITKAMEDFSPENYYTVALAENTGSNFQSDFVGMYYDDSKEDLHYWWERPNNHWDWH